MRYSVAPPPPLPPPPTPSSFPEFIFDETRTLSAAGSKDCASPVTELYFLPAQYRGWTRAGVKRVQDNLHAHAQNAAIFPPKSGKNHIWKYFPDLPCGAIFWMIIYKQQFLHSDWSVEFHQCHAKLHSICFFYHNIKDNKRNLCQDLLTIENSYSDLKVHALHYANSHLHASDFPFKNFCKIAQ